MRRLPAVARALVVVRGEALIALVAALVALVALAAPAPARASETVQDRFARMLGAMKTARDPVDAVLALWQAAELATSVPEGVARFQASAKALTASRAPHVAAEAKLALAVSLAQTGTPDPALFREAGVPPAVRVLGPFAGAVGPLPAPAEGTPGKHGPTRWRFLPSGATPTIEVADAMPSVGDAHMYVHVPFATKGGSYRVVLGSNGALTAELDGVSLATFTGERTRTDWQHDVAVKLAPGTHRLTIAIGHGSAAPELSLRILPIGKAPPLDFPADASASTTPTGTCTLDPRAPPGLVALAKTLPQSARLALYVDPSPPSERRAARLLETLRTTTGTSAADMPARAEVSYLLGRAEATDASRAVAAFEAADSFIGGHAQALAALLDRAERDGLFARADELARRLAALDPRHPAALGHRILRRFELGDALAALPLVPRDLPHNPRLVALEATLAESAGELARAVDAYRRLAAIQLGDSEPMQRGVQLALRAGRRDDALALTSLVSRYRPVAVDVTILRARTRASGPDNELAFGIAELDAARAFHDQDPQLEEMRGRMLLLAGERGKAIDAFDRALELAPQDRELADYRRSLVSERGLADRWAEPLEGIVARAQATPRKDEGAVYLLERTVTEVFASGLASQFRQIALRIDQRSATERFEDMVFAFTPGEDRLEILEAEVLRKSGDELVRIRPQQIGEQAQQGKSEGVYTLTAYKVVRFPALEVGDVVHIQLRKDETGSRNLFGDFFGVVFPLSGEFPKARVEAIVVAPASRPLYHHATRVPEAVVTSGDGQQRLTFSADDLPPLAIEPSMPGYADIGAWASVSTFASWQDLAAWYRGLVAPQLEVPPELAKTAAELVQGAATLEAKVAAIHRWVVTKTRYVGIEFGIHGFKPYKVAEVVQRGYGDCKDKAALLVAMLRAAGVPAEFVLVRTRDLGALDGTPATLWAFNHAIAYVPGLDVYLDGTAESSGLRELPELDQDAQVLRLDLYSAAPPVLTRVPIQPSLENKVVSSARYVFDDNGDASADLIETIAGTSAGRLRNRLQDPTRRDGIIAEVIAGQHPGTALETASYDNLDRLGAPVSIKARIRLPKLAERKDDTLELPLVLEPGSRLLEMAPLAVRRQPLVLTQTELEENTDTYVLPPGASLIAVPPPVAVTSPFGSWHMDVRKEGADVVATSRWELTATRIAPADYPAFRKFLEDVTRTESARLRFALAK